MPLLQQQRPIFYYQPLNTSEFCWPESEIHCERNRVEPELRRIIITVHVDVGRFVWFMAIEVHTVRTRHQHGRHFPQYDIRGRFTTDKSLVNRNQQSAELRPRGESTREGAAIACSR